MMMMTTMMMMMMMMMMMRIALQAALADVGQQLDNLLQDVRTIRRFHQLVQTASPPIDEFITLKKQLSSKGHSFSLSYDQHEIKLQSTQCMMRNDATQLCGLLNITASGPVAKLAEHGLDKESLQGVAGGVAQDTALEVLSQLVPADVAIAAAKCPAKQTLLLFRDAVSKAAESTDFLVPADAVKDIMLLGLLEPRALDTKTLDAILSDLEAESFDAFKRLPVASFFWESSVGLKLVQHAEENLKSRRHEAKREDSVVEHEKRAMALQTLPWFMPKDYVEHEALENNAELKAFIDNSTELEEELEKEVQAAGKRARKDSPNPWLLRVQGAERKCGKPFSRVSKTCMLTLASPSASVPWKRPATMVSARRTRSRGPST